MKTMIRDLTKIFLMCIIISAVACNKEVQPGPSGGGVEIDTDAAFGWVTCTSLDGGDEYRITGGEERAVTLTSTGADMRGTISRAIQNYDKIIFDGSNGPFYMSSKIELVGLKNKTLVGINDACLKSVFFVTPEIKANLEAFMEENGVGTKSSSMDFGASAIGSQFAQEWTLPNGKKVKDKVEYYVRLFMIQYLNDMQESYRGSGMFILDGCENIIIQNLAFEGPGAMNTGGSDLLNVTNGTKYLWVDHCSFTDGMDGNFDINIRSDFITVSWCTFAYTEKTFNHEASNLVGSTSQPIYGEEDNLNVTFAYCKWDKGCRSRMPFVTFGKAHVLNCWYDCAGNNYPVVQLGKDAEVLVENCYFDSGVTSILREDDALGWQFTGNFFKEGSEYEPESNAAISLPYEYKAFPAENVPEILGGENGVGPTLYR